MENNSLNNILWNIEISYNNKHRILLNFLTGTVSAVYLFTQNYTQTAIACGENKLLISIEMYIGENNGSIVNVNIIQLVSNK